jgi:hypothetical protein
MTFSRSQAQGAGGNRDAAPQFGSGRQRGLERQRHRCTRPAFEGARSIGKTGVLFFRSARAIMARQNAIGSTNRTRFQRAGPEKWKPVFENRE